MNDRSRLQNFILPGLVILLIRLGWYIVILLLLIVTGCLPTSAPAVPEQTTDPIPVVVLKVSGSGSVTPLLETIKPAFEADTPGYHLEVLSGSGTGGGVKGVIDGLLDVAAMARPPTDEETAQNLQYTELGWGGVAIYTHPDVGLTNLTVAQIRSIISGEIKQWAAVGGPDERIILYVRDENDSSTKAVRDTILGQTTAVETTSQILTSQANMLTAVSGTPHSVGFGAWPTALASQSEVHAIALDGVAPTNPAYPMTSPLGIGYLAEREAEVQPLIDWLVSERGRTELQTYGVILTE